MSLQSIKMSTTGK